MQEQEHLLQGDTYLRRKHMTNRPKKQYIVINYENEPIFAAIVRNGTSDEYLKELKTATTNIDKLVKQYKLQILELEAKINDLQKEIKYLKGEE